MERAVEGEGDSQAWSQSAVEARDETESEGEIPIGRPIWNVRLYILDEQQQLLPVGVSGELYISGVALGRGYLRRPELTAEKFVPDPYGVEGGARMYRTGDVGRYRGDGAIEYLGRVDEQVKIRGYRVELGEIEAVLAGHEEVREAVVVTREDESGEKRLVAYVVVVGQAGEGASEQEEEEERGGEEAGRRSRGERSRGWQQWMKERVPQYMVPAEYVELEALPQLANGKIDRRRLEQEAKERKGAEEERGREGGEERRGIGVVAELLVGMWEEVLGVRGVREEDNFFDLGGHSLRVMQITSRIREVFQVNLQMRVLFENPTVASLSKIIEEMIWGKTDLPGISLQPVAHDGEMPLSFGQQRLWFLDQLAPNSAFYNMHAGLHLSGQLDLAALARSFTHLIGRHESLRTVFRLSDGQPLQLILPAAQCPLPLLDLTALPQPLQPQEVTRLAQQQARRPFDLSTGPLLRLLLLRLAEDEHVLLLTMHHIISDGWSMGVLVREVMALYEAELGGTTAELAPLPIQYADYAHWQREWLTGERLGEQLSYWREQLAGAPQLLDLPTDHPRPAVQSYRGATHSFVLDEELSRKLKALSRREGVTLFMVLLGAYGVLLSRYSGAEEVVVGTPVAGRTRMETEGLIGFFVNTLALRVKVQGERSFREVLEGVRRVALGGYEHQELPFEKLVEELQPERDLSRNPLFQVVLSLQNTPQMALRVLGLLTEWIQVERGASNSDLGLFIHEDGERLYCVVEYNTDLFEAGTIKRMMDHFGYLLEGVVTNPEQKVCLLPLLSPDERERLVEAPARSEKIAVSTLTLHQLFEAQAQRTPDAIAVVCEGEQLTYAELNRRANQLARYLNRRGVGPEVPVAIFTERSVEMLVGLLGILKSGGAYVPLDPAYPQERLSFIMKDAGVRLLLTQEALRVALPTEQAKVIRLDADWREIALESAEDHEGLATAENLAYIIYTSGSTGRPKGVQVNHGSVVNLFEVTRPMVELNEQDLCTVFHSYSFDFSVWEIWGPLLYGARLVIVPRQVAQSPAEFYQLLLDEKVTVLNLTPSALRQLLLVRDGAGQTDDGLKVRLVICGGEALSGELAGRLLRWNIPSWNFYGPTEASVWTAVKRLEASDQKHDIVPLDLILGNTQLYILDQYGQAVPVGIPGELHIGGLGLARGYLNRPELTAERFVPNSFGERKGARLYRTGDLARWLASGQIEFLGRSDYQVKVRGYRIELGEIEAALVRHPRVIESVVAVQDSTSGEQRLVAYLVVDREQPVPSVAELRTLLKQGLPEYMVPGAYMFLEQLPLNVSGKVDRKALPAPEQFEQQFTPTDSPRSSIEEVLAGIWCEVLQVSAVGREQNFFELGGHSLLATQVISRVRDVLQVELPLQTLFEAPTLAGLVKSIEAARRAEDQTLQSPPILPVARDQELLLSFAQERLWFLSQLEPATLAHNVPIAVHLTGRLDISALEQTLDELVCRHEVLRTTFDMADERPRLRLSDPAPLQLPLVDLSMLPKREREIEARRFIAEDAIKPFDLSRSPLMRVTLLRMSMEEYIITLTMHHIVMDDWSSGVLIREVATLYQAFSAGQPSPLPELPIQYADFAAWQRRWLQGETLEAQLDYWRNQLAGMPLKINLPVDRQPPARPTFRAARHPLSFSIELTDQLEALSRREGVTLFMLLLAAYEVLIYYHTKQEDLIVGTPIANRNQVEIENLLGFFVNLLVLRTDLSGNPTFPELLRRVRQVALKAYDHQDLPFEKLVEELRPERKFKRMPLIQVAFALQNAPKEMLSIPGLALNTLEVYRERTTFDLTLEMENGAQGLAGIFEYDTDLFDETTIASLAEQLKQIISIAVSAPEVTLEQFVERLDEAGRQQLIAREREMKEATVQKFKRVRRKSESEALRSVSEASSTTD